MKKNLSKMRKMSKNVFYKFEDILSSHKYRYQTSCNNNVMVEVPQGKDFQVFQDHLDEICNDAFSELALHGIFIGLFAVEQVILLDFKDVDVTTLTLNDNMFEIKITHLPTGNFTQGTSSLLNKQKKRQELLRELDLKVKPY